MQVLTSFFFDLILLILFVVVAVAECHPLSSPSVSPALRDDYAVILLLDERYAQPRITSRLPLWISQSLVHMPSQQAPKVPSLCV